MRKKSALFQFSILVIFGLGPVAAQVSVKDYERAAIERVRRQKAERAAAERAQNSQPTLLPPAQQNPTTTEARINELQRAAADRARRQRAAAAEKARQQRIEEQRKAEAAAKRRRQMETLEALKRAAQKGDAIAARKLGEIYISGAWVPASLSQSQYWFKMSADKGDILGQIAYAKGVLRASTGGSGVAEYEKYIAMAASGGSAEGKFLLADFYARSNDEQQRKRSLQLLKESAELGFVEAIASMGKIYQEGELVKKDYKVALDYLARASGSGLANYHLGIAYEKGWGVARSSDRAFLAYRRSSELGYTAARERMLAVDPFGYRGKGPATRLENNLSMLCPERNSTINVEIRNGWLFVGGRSIGYAEKEEGRNNFRYKDPLTKFIWMADFDNVTYVNKTFIGQAVTICQDY